MFAETGDRKAASEAIRRVKIFFLSDRVVYGERMLVDTPSTEHVFGDVIVKQDDEVCRSEHFGPW
jgi:hypothetical protein